MDLNSIEFFISDLVSIFALLSLMIRNYSTTDQKKLLLITYGLPLALNVVLLVIISISEPIPDNEFLDLLTIFNLVSIFSILLIWVYYLFRGEDPNKRTKTYVKVVGLFCLWIPMFLSVVDTVIATNYFISSELIISPEATADFFSWLGGNIVIGVLTGIVAGVFLGLITKK